MKKKYSLGIGLNLSDARAVLLDSNQKIVLKKEVDRFSTTANGTIETILSLCDDMFAKAKESKADIAGIGLALGGIVNRKKGLVFWPQRTRSSCSYISVPLKKHLENKFKVPVILENDANACAWAEYKNSFSKYENVIYMFSGVGCGMVLDGSLYTGKDAAAGELFVVPGKTMDSVLGDFSFLSHWPLDLDIVKRAKKMISLGKNSSLVTQISSTGKLKLEHVFSQAKKNDKVSKTVLKEAALALGARISFLVNLMNPDVVVIGGGFEEAGDIFLSELQKVVDRFSFNEILHNFKLSYAKLGREATSLGAAFLVLDKN